LFGSSHCWKAETSGCIGCFACGFYDDVLERAQRAEDAGFSYVLISDHFHPWNDEQGQSPFVWSVIGALSQQVTLPITTAVTCPTVRTHPAVIAHATATSAVLCDGRFALGVGSGEALNEHIFGDAWPAADERMEMLEEAVAVIRLLNKKSRNKSLA